MNAVQAQQIIDDLPKRKEPNEVQLETLRKMKVDYQSVDEMPRYRRERLQKCIDYIVDKYNPPSIDLVMSQLNGYPIDEHTTDEEREAKALIGKSKFSDWDFIVPGIDEMQIIENINAEIKIDLFKYHHGGVRKLRVYE